MRYLFFLFVWLLIPASVHASADLLINPQDIRFSQPVLVAGDQVRIYAKIYNVGDEDVSGFVSFYQGSVLIDDSVVISLPANGNADEVYVDFVVPEGSFNIWAIVRGTDPSDLNSTNDSALTPPFIPVLDDDRDTIPNSEDNCPGSSNSDQINTDADGEGNACDVDDDNDGLSDDVETELHSDATLVDTDGDGVNDAEDAFPDDADRVIVEEQAATPPTSEAFQRIVEEVAKTIKETAEVARTETDEQVQGDEPLTQTQTIVASEMSISPNAVFAYTQDDWNTFTFSVLTNVQGQAVSLWDFGDGVSSSKSSVTHVYTSSGVFLVTLTMTDENGLLLTEQTTVLVPFFHLKNPFVLAAVLVLSLLLVVGTMSFIRLGKKTG